MTATVSPPIPIASTRVTGRRIVQYVLDVFLAGVVLALLSVLLNALAPGAGFDRVPGDLVDIGRLAAPGGWPSSWAVLLTAVVWSAVFVIVPAWRGRTPAMMLLGLRIVRTDGGRASFGQHLGRGLLLIVDSIAVGLLGWIVIVCSSRRQRVGDHAAATVVVRDRG